MSTLLDSLKSAVSHEGEKRKFFNVLSNPASSTEERAKAYNGLMVVANHQDWNWLMSQFEQNLGELNSQVMGCFFTGAAQHCRERLKKFVSAEDGVVLTSVKAINTFSEFAGASLFMAHRALSALEALGMEEELKAFAEYVVLACGSKASNGLVPRKLFEERLKQYLPTDVVADQEEEFQKVLSQRRLVAEKPRKAPEGRRPLAQKETRGGKDTATVAKDEPIDEEGRTAAAQAAGSPEEVANYAFAGLASMQTQ